MNISGLESKSIESEYLDRSLEMLILKALKMSLKQRKIKSRIEEYLNTPYWTSIPYYSSLSIVVSAFPYDQSTETQAFEEKNLEAKKWVVFVTSSSYRSQLPTMNQ